MGCSQSVSPVNPINHHPHVPSLATSALSPPVFITSRSETENTTIINSDCHADPNELIQSFLLIWLDTKIDESKRDFRNSIKNLRVTVKTIEVFHDIDECICYMKKLKTEKVFLMISGALCQSVIPNIHQFNQIYSIFIFCRQPSKYQQWAKDWSKVKMIASKITLICNAVRQSARQCDEDSITINTVSSLNQIEPSFMYTQLLKEIILQIDFNETQEITLLIDYLRKKYQTDDGELQTIDEFDRDYKGNSDGENNPIWWYTRQCFTYQMVNKALRNLDVEVLLKMGIFIRDLHVNIMKLHSKQFDEAHDTSLTVTKLYRGQTMNMQDFQAKIRENGLISFNSFLSTSEDQRVAHRFINEGIMNSEDDNKIGILFTMTIGRTTSSAPFARIKGISFYQSESEVLFSMHTVFRIKSITQNNIDNIKIQEVSLTLTSESEDDQLKTLTEQFRQEITGTGWQRMGSLLRRMGQSDKAEQVYTMLLEQASNDNDKAYCYNGLGLIKDNLGNYKMALEFYEKSLAITGKTLRPDHPDLTASYNNIGAAYDNLGEYSKALEFYEKSLAVREKSLPSDHRDLAIAYNNIGSVYKNMEEYSKALEFYEKGFVIFKKILPSNHPDLAVSYNNMGSIYDNMEDYSKALEYYEKDLEISQKTLPPNHPDLATSYNNIGLVYNSMGKNSEALLYYETALAIYEASLVPSHPHIALVKTHIESVKTTS